LEFKISIMILFSRSYKVGLVERTVEKVVSSTPSLIFEYK